MRESYTIPHPELGGVTIQWSARLTRTLGKAQHWNRTVILSEKAWAVLSKDERKEVLAHELAHLVAFERYGAQAWNHGALWRAVMEEMGYPNPSSTTSNPALNAIQRPKTRVVATCPCGKVYFLTEKKAEKVANLACRKCWGKLTLGKTITTQE